jgi:hypothetical protein
MPATHASCIDPRNAAFNDGMESTITVKPDQVVVVALAVPERDATDEFPWQPASSTDDSVLAPVAVCSDPPIVTSVPVRYAAFRALAAGATDVIAPIAADWAAPSPCNADGCVPLSPLNVRVVVSGS